MGVTGASVEAGVRVAGGRQCCEGRGWSADVLRGAGALPRARGPGLGSSRRALGPPTSSCWLFPRLEAGLSCSREGLGTAPPRPPSTSPLCTNGRRAEGPPAGARQARGTLPPLSPRLREVPRDARDRPAAGRLREGRVARPPTPGSSRRPPPATPTAFPARRPAPAAGQARAHTLLTVADVVVGVADAEVAPPVLHAVAPVGALCVHVAGRGRDFCREGKPVSRPRAVGGTACP